MANDKKNINELVPTDDDPTAELEVLEISESQAEDHSEASATTTGYPKSSIAARASAKGDSEPAESIRVHSDAVDKLQFDLELLQAKWRGLTTEVEARDEQAKRLNAELKTTKQELLDSKQHISQRDDQIDRLKRNLESRDAAYRKLEDDFASLQHDLAEDGASDAQKKQQVLDALNGQLATRDLETRELHSRLAQIEEYADELRYQLRLESASADDIGNRLEAVELQLSSANEQSAELQSRLDEALKQNASLEEKISSMNDTHAEEIRMIRFELGDAQATLTEQESMAEQLANDLIQTRGVREELEQKLADVEESNRNRYAALERENKQLQLDAEAMTEQLHNKTEAISALLAELANSSHKTEQLSEKHDTAEATEDRISEHVDDSAYVERDRVARMLIGRFADQDLRFPLFKDRLTIGRTPTNDIQLKSQHVSRRHAVVVTEGDVTRVIDWGSKNGVFVNARRIKEHFLQNGDVVGVGTAEFRYEERPMRDT